MAQQLQQQESDPQAKQMQKRESELLDLQAAAQTRRRNVAKRAVKAQASVPSESSGGSETDQEHEKAKEPEEAEKAKESKDPEKAKELENAEKAEESNEAEKQKSPKKLERQKSPRTQRFWTQWKSQILICLWQRYAGRHICCLTLR